MRKYILFHLFIKFFLLILDFQATTSLPYGILNTCVKPFCDPFCFRGEMRNFLFRALQHRLNVMINDSRKQQIDQLLLNLIITDLQPFSIVEDKGFKEFVKFMDPKYEIPSAKTLKKLLLAKYEKEKEKVSEELQNNDKICITTDTWTSINTDSFLTVTCHLVNKNFEFKSYTIHTSKVCGSHTAIAIANHLDKVLIDRKIQGKISAVVTDNAANMLASVRNLQEPTDHIPCFAHTLNLVVKKALNNIPAISMLRGKCRRLVTHFKLSALAKDKLNEVQIILGTPQHKLLIEVETRWNSTYRMFDRLYEQRSAIVLAMSSLETNFDMLLDAEWEALRKILPVLQPFLIVTEEISAEKRVTISKVILIKKQLNMFLHKSLDGNGIDGELSSQLMTQLNKYLCDIEINKKYAIAALLDPRFRDLSFSDESHILQARDNLINIGNTYNLCSSAATSTSVTKIIPQVQDCQTFWSSFDRHVQDKNEASTQNTFMLEFNNYMKEPYVNRKIDPLDYWKTNSRKFPILSTLAKEYFCITATSVPAERVFSKAGELISKKRNRLKENIVDKLLFLNSIKE